MVLRSGAVAGVLFALAFAGCTEAPVPGPADTDSETTATETSAGSSDNQSAQPIVTGPPPFQVTSPDRLFFSTGTGTYQEASIEFTAAAKLVRWRWDSDGTMTWAIYPPNTLFEIPEASCLTPGSGVFAALGYDGTYDPDPDPEFAPGVYTLFIHSHESSPGVLVLYFDGLGAEQREVRLQPSIRRGEVVDATSMSSSAGTSAQAEFYEEFDVGSSAILVRHFEAQPFIVYGKRSIAVELLEPGGGTCVAISESVTGAPAMNEAMAFDGLELVAPGTGYAWTGRYEAEAAAWAGPDAEDAASARIGLILLN